MGDGYPQDQLFRNVVELRDPVVGEDHGQDVEPASLAFPAQPLTKLGMQDQKLSPNLTIVLNNVLHYWKLRSKRV